MRYLDRDGREITLDQFATEPCNRVAVTKLERCTVSTIWTGLDVGDGLIFETLIICGGEVEDSERYATELDAARGHLRWVGRYS